MIIKHGQNVLTSVRCVILSTVTDCLKVGDISRIVYKPTGDMESDYLTKSLQDKSFHAHRKSLMGLDGINEHMFYEKYKNDKIPSK